MKLRATLALGTASALFVLAGVLKLASSDASGTLLRVSWVRVALGSLEIVIGAGFLVPRYRVSCAVPALLIALGGLAYAVGRVIIPLPPCGCFGGGIPEELHAVFGGLIVCSLTEILWPKSASAT